MGVIWLQEKNLREVWVRKPEAVWTLFEVFTLTDVWLLRQKSKKVCLARRAGHTSHLPKQGYYSLWKFSYKF